MKVRNRFSAERVTVVTGARLHLGFYAFDEGDRLYGGLGLAVTRPTYMMRIERSDKTRIEGCQADRAKQLVEKVFRDLGIDGLGLSIELTECIPEHVGLGSTTQLALALYVGAAAVTGRRVDAYEAARLSGRGKVSGIGVAAFKYGGFIVDCGRPRTAPPDYVVKPLLRLTFPTTWVPVVVVPRTKWHVSEEAEPELFERSGGLSEAERGRLLHVVFRRLVPAIIDRDFTVFTSALEEVQRLTGLYFSGAQGGIFCCPESELAAELLRAIGARGVGQSSWGPLVYGFYPSFEQASRAARVVGHLLEREGIEALMVGVARPRNSGAKLLTS